MLTLSCTYYKNVKVPGWNFGRVAPFKKTAAKLQGLWNCQNRRTVAANQIKEAIGKDGKAALSTGYGDAYVAGYKTLWGVK